jgi:hypothetical protein
MVVVGLVVADEEAVVVVSSPPWPPIDALTQRMEIIDLTADDPDDDEADGAVTTMNDEAPAGGGNGGSPAPPASPTRGASSSFVVEEPPSLYGDDDPPLSEERFVFYAAFEELVFLEFQYRGLTVENALEGMWMVHEDRFGPHCHEGCPCFEYLGELAEQAFYYPHARHPPYHRRRRNGYRSQNLLSCFVPKFLRRLALEYPHESRRQLGYRIQRMWHIHGAAASEPYLTHEFTLPCCYTADNNNNNSQQGGDDHNNNDDQNGGYGCRCHDYWDTLFNRGNCTPLSSYAGVSICDHVDAIRTFCTKYRAIVTAEFAKTDFPDATLFALGRMWQRHVDRFGERCDANCPCYTVVPDLAGTVVGEMLQRQQHQYWTNPLQLTVDSVPSGVLLCYARHHNEAFGTAVLQKYLATATVTKQQSLSRDENNDDIDDDDDGSLPHLAWHKFLWAWPANTGRPCTTNSGSSCRCQQQLDIIMDT